MLIDRDRGGAECAQITFPMLNIDPRYLRPPRFRRALQTNSWQRQLIGRGQQDPNWWIRTILGVLLWSKQCEIVDSVARYERTIVPAAFSLGKTFVAACIALWFLFCFRPSKVVCTAATNRQIRDLLWSEIRATWHNARYPLGGEAPLQQQLRLGPDHYAIGFSPRSEIVDAFTGYHSPSQLVIFDQSAGILESIWQATETLLSGEHCRWLCLGNTAINTGTFADICIPGRNHTFGEWNKIKITALESPNVQTGEVIVPGIVTKRWVDDRLKAWGEKDPLWQIYGLAEFAADSVRSLLTTPHLDLAINSPGTMSNTIDIGMDVGWRGTDSTVWFARSGSRALHMRKVTGNDTSQVFKETMDYVPWIESRFRKKVETFRIDSTGIGAGPADRLLAETSIPVEPVIAAEAAIDSMRFQNVRAEMGWMLRERVENRDLGLAQLECDDPDAIKMLHQECRLMRYTLQKRTQKILLADKDDLRKLIGRSPDHFDALKFAYESPGGGEFRVATIASDARGNLESAEAQVRTTDTPAEVATRVKDEADRHMESLLGDDGWV